MAEINYCYSCLSCVKVAVVGWCGQVLSLVAVLLEMLQAVSGRKGEAVVNCCSCGASLSLGPAAPLMCEVPHLPAWLLLRQPAAADQGDQGGILSTPTVAASLASLLIHYTHTQCAQFCV